MIKVVSTFKMRADRPRDECDRHYLEIHVPMVAEMLRGIPGVLGYVQNRTKKPVAFDFNGTDPRVVEPLFDWMVEFWFAHRDARVAMAEHPTMSRIIADHPNFMDVNTERCMEYYLADEHVAIWTEGLRPGT